MDPDHYHLTSISGNESGECIHILCRRWRVFRHELVQPRHSRTPHADIGSEVQFVNQLSPKYQMNRSCKSKSTICYFATMTSFSCFPSESVLCPKRGRCRLRQARPRRFLSLIIQEGSAIFPRCQILFQLSSYNWVRPWVRPRLVE